MDVTAPGPDVFVPLLELRELFPGWDITYSIEGWAWLARCGCAWP